METYSAFAAGVATGTDKTLLNLFSSPATPTHRFGLSYLTLGSVATPADQAMKGYVARTTAVGTEGSGFAPNNLDPAGPAGEVDAGVGVFGAEPTYTSNKELLVFSVNQRATFQWYANEGCEILGAATQNNGLGIKSKSSTSTQAVEVTTFHKE